MIQVVKQHSMNVQFCNENNKQIIISKIKFVAESELYILTLLNIDKNRLY